ncbi:MAG: matrixin family metalloprotease [Nitrososphaerales archaeon]
MAHISHFGRVLAACCLAALAAFLLAGRTDATSIRLPLTELSASSPLVVRGRVERIESAWNADRQIDSTVYVRLAEVPRGRLSAGALIPVRVHGGTVDGLTMVSSEEPTFSVGEDVYLFLGELQGDAYRLPAGYQGKFDVAGDEASNPAWKGGLKITDLEEGVLHGRWPAEPDASGKAAASAVDAAPDTYVYNNAKWFGANPMEENLLINVNSNDAGTANGSAEQFRNAILAAAYTWNNAGARFAFKYGGLTGASSWTNDGNNIVYWQNLGQTPTLAETQWWYSNGQILDVDLRFNDYYAWDVTSRPSSNEPDLQSVATHELGHWLSLGHDTDRSCPTSTATMCATYSLGTLKRSLGMNDIAGIKAIYGAVPQLQRRMYLPLVRRR